MNASRCAVVCLLSFGLALPAYSQSSPVATDDQRALIELLHAVLPELKGGAQLQLVDGGGEWRFRVDRSGWRKAAAPEAEGIARIVSGRIKRVEIRVPPNPSGRTVVRADGKSGAPVAVGVAPAPDDLARTPQEALERAHGALARALGRFDAKIAGFSTDLGNAGRWRFDVETAAGALAGRYRLEFEPTSGRLLSIEEK